VPGERENRDERFRQASHFESRVRRRTVYPQWQDCGDVYLSSVRIRTLFSNAEGTGS
jgi:hypothetical protein